MSEIELTRAALQQCGSDMAAAAEARAAAEGTPCRAADALEQRALVWATAANAHATLALAEVRS